MKNSIRSDAKNESGLSKDAQDLLNQLVNDYSSTLPVEERKFNIKNRAAYIYNLFRANIPKYSFSSKTYTELFEYFCNYKENKS